MTYDPNKYLNDVDDHLAACHQRSKDCYAIIESLEQIMGQSHLKVPTCTWQNIREAIDELLVHAGEAEGEYQSILGTWSDSIRALQDAHIDYSDRAAQAAGGPDNRVFAAYLHAFEYAIKLIERASGFWIAGIYKAGENEDTARYLGA